MKTPEQVLHKYFHHFNNERTRDLVVKAMQEYADQQCDAVHELFMRPQEVLKPLQDLYRKENPHPEGRFYLPDATEFFKWIVKKVEYGERNKFTPDEIDNVIVDIMVEDGGDGHIDGHELITDFVIKLLHGTGSEWVENYKKSKRN